MILRTHDQAVFRAAKGDAAKGSIVLMKDIRKGARHGTRILAIVS